MKKHVNFKYKAYNSSQAQNLPKKENSAYCTYAEKAHESG